jgi:hypothetical protein
MATPAYSYLQLAEAVRANRSFAGVLRQLKIKQGGGTQQALKAKIMRAELDTSHFKGQAWHRGDVRGNQTDPALVLVQLEPGSGKTRTSKLRQALLAVGERRECRECGQGPEWNGKPLTLEIDHIDGSWLNNTRSNLRFLCPNCHAQQETTNRPWKSRLAPSSERP